MKNIDFSIIIPIYNASEFLGACLESALRQTYHNIEIIGIDDASSDESLAILKKFSSRDRRIRIISKNINEGTSKARKDGVLCSKGRHILFLDADDQLIEYACEKLLEVYAEKEADIIQFDAYVNTCNGINADKANEVTQYLKPYCSKISIEEVQDRCFNIGDLSHSIWGKMFDGDICRKAFAYVSDDKMIMAEDLYAYFIITVFASAYRGIPDKLYQYNYGAGITGENHNFLEAFENNAKQLLIPLKCYEFIEKIGVKEKYSALVEGIKNYLLDVFINFWIHYNKNIKKEDITLISKILLQNCTGEDLGRICTILGMCCQNHELVMRNRGWIFPYQDVAKGSKVILYGAGRVGSDYYTQLIKTEYCEVVAWVDKAYEKFMNNKNVIQPPDIINTLEYDYIIIAIKDIAVRNIVKRYLKSMNVKEDSIIAE